MRMLSRYINLKFHIDANRINAFGNLKYMNILQHWFKNGVIYIEMSEVAQDEACKGENSKRFEKACKYLATVSYVNTIEEKRLVEKIKTILFPNGVIDRSELNDVKIVFNAKKYDSILITDDGDSKRQPMGILGNASKLHLLGIKAIRDQEAVELVTSKIKERDKRAKRIAETIGEALPEWIGSDLVILQGA